MRPPSCSLSPVVRRLPAWLVVLPLLSAAAPRSVGAAPARGSATGAAAAPSSHPATNSAIERLAPGVQIDWDRGVLIAAGSCAADLFAASAEVARVKAERLARLRAEDRLRKALGLLGADKDKARAERLGRLLPAAAGSALGRLDPARATVAHIDYGSTGSVSLRLELPLRPTAPAPDAAPAPSTPDAGSAPEAEASGSSE